MTDDSYLGEGGAIFLQDVPILTDGATSGVANVVVIFTGNTAMEQGGAMTVKHIYKGKTGKLIDIKDNATVKFTSNVVLGDTSLGVTGGAIEIQGCKGFADTDGEKGCYLSVDGVDTSVIMDGNKGKA